MHEVTTSHDVYVLMSNRTGGGALCTHRHAQEWGIPELMTQAMYRCLSFDFERAV